MRLFFYSLSVLFACSCQPKSTEIMTASHSPQIVGGKELKDSDTLSSMIVGVYDVEEQFLCTGTLISENVVVTAAHCVISKPSKMKVIFGLDAYLTLNARELDIQQEFVRRVLDVKVHEHYTGEGTESSQTADQNDIAIVKFAGSLPSGYQVATLLGHNSELAPGVEAVLAGFGVSEVELTPIESGTANRKKIMQGIETGEIVCDNNLQNCFQVDMTGDGTLRTAKAKIKLISESEVRLDESHGQGTCSGDSGGPAFVQQGDKYYLWGVTSRGNLLCDFEGVYTNILAHQQWLAKAISNLK